MQNTEENMNPTLNPPTNTMSWEYTPVDTTGPEDLVSCDLCRYRPTGNVCSRLKGIVPESRSCHKFKRK